MYSPRELWKVKRAKILSVRWSINGGFITGLKKRFKASYIVVGVGLIEGCIFWFYRYMGLDWWVYGFPDFQVQIIFCTV